MSGTAMAGVMKLELSEFIYLECTEYTNNKFPHILTFYLHSHYARNSGGQVSKRNLLNIFGKSSIFAIESSQTRGKPLNLSIPSLNDIE